MHGAIVKFHALANTDRSAAQHHDLLFPGFLYFIFHTVGRVIIGCLRIKFCRTGIHHLVDGENSPLFAQGTDGKAVLVPSCKLPDSHVCKAVGLYGTQKFRCQFFCFQAVFQRNDMQNFFQKEFINFCNSMSFFHGHAPAERFRKGKEPLVINLGYFVKDLLIRQGM